MSRMKRFSVYGWMLMFAFFGAGCGQSTPPDTPTQPATLTSIPPTPTIRPTPPDENSTGNITRETVVVRIVNTAADTPPLNLYFGFQSIATNLEPGQFTEPTPVEAGEYIAKILPSGSRSSDPGLMETQLNLSGETAFLILITGNIGQYGLTVLPEKPEPLSAGESIIRFVNAIPEISDALLRSGEEDLTSRIGFEQTALSSVLQAGETPLELLSGDKKLLDYSIALEERMDYTLILAGKAEAPTIIAYSSRAPGKSTLRTINASSAINVVDVYLGDALFNSKIDYGRPTQRQSIASGDYIVQVYEAGADRTTVQPLLSELITFQADQNIALILLGSSDQLRIVPYIEDLSPTPPEEIRIAFLNTLDHLQSVHLETTGGPIPGIPELVYGSPTVISLNASNFSFYSTAVDANGVNNTVEVVTNLQFEQGVSYLYLITGRLDNNPIMLSESVGVDSTLANSVESQGTPQPRVQAAMVRFVNDLQDQTIVDFLVNNETAFPGLAFEQATELISISDLTPNIRVTVSGNADLLGENDVSLDENGRYTIIIYGADKSTVRFLVISDSDLVFDRLSAHIRLINLSPDIETQLGLGYALSSQSPEIILPSEPGAQRPLVTRDIQQSVNQSGGGSVSNPILMPLGVFNLYVIDSSRAEIGVVLANLTLEGGAHYDVVASQATNSNQAQAFLLKYP